MREDDHGVLYPTLRAAIAVQEPEAPGQSPPAEVELQVMHADDSTGDLDYELLQVSAALRWNVIHDDKATLGLFAGLAYEDDSFDLDAPVMADDEEDRFGALIGARLGYRVLPRAELYARAQTARYLAGNSESNSNQYEAGLSVRFAEAVSAFVAWQRWDVNLDEAFSINIDEIHLQTDGIAFGLELWF